MVSCAFASFLFYLCVAFPSGSDVKKFVESVPWFPECHAPVNTRTDKPGSEGHRLSFCVRRIGQRRIRRVPFVYFAHLIQFPSKVSLKQ